MLGWGNSAALVILFRRHDAKLILIGTRSKPLTIIRLLQCSVKVSDRFEDKKLCFEIATPDQSYFLLAESADEMRNWIFSIRQASGRYSPQPLIWLLIDHFRFSLYARHLYRLIKEAMQQGEEAPLGGFHQKEPGGALGGLWDMSYSADDVGQYFNSSNSSPKRPAGIIPSIEMHRPTAIIEGFLYKRKSPAKSGKRIWASLQTESLFLFKQPSVRRYSLP